MKTVGMPAKHYDFPIEAQGLMSRARYVQVGQAHRIQPDEPAISLVVYIFPPLNDG